MTWWWLILGLAFAAIFWQLSRPISVRDVQRGAFARYFEALLVNSRKRAWIKISDDATNDTLVASKRDDLGTLISFEISASTAKAAQDVMRIIEAWEAAQGGAIIDRSATEKAISVVVRLPEGRSISQAADLAISVFDGLGSSPAQRFTLQGSGRPDLEHWRPLLRSLKGERRGSKSRRIGEEGIRLLNRRRKNQKERQERHLS